MGSQFFVLGIGFQITVSENVAPGRETIFELTSHRSDHESTRCISSHILNQSLSSKRSNAESSRFAYLHLCASHKRGSNLSSHNDSCMAENGNSVNTKRVKPGAIGLAEQPTDNERWGIIIYANELREKRKGRKDAHPYSLSLLVVWFVPRNMILFSSMWEC